MFYKSEALRTNIEKQLKKAKLAEIATNKQNIGKVVLDFKGKEIVTRKMVMSNANTNKGDL